MVFLINLSLYGFNNKQDEFYLKRFAEKPIKELIELKPKEWAWISYYLMKNVAKPFSEKSFFSEDEAVYRFFLRQGKEIKAPFLNYFYFQMKNALNIHHSSLSKFPGSFKQELQVLERSIDHHLEKPSEISWGETMRDAAIFYALSERMGSTNKGRFTRAFSKTELLDSLFYLVSIRSIDKTPKETENSYLILPVYLPGVGLHGLRESLLSFSSQLFPISYTLDSISFDGVSEQEQPGLALPNHDVGHFLDTVWDLSDLSDYLPTDFAKELPNFRYYTILADRFFADKSIKPSKLPNFLPLDHQQDILEQNCLNTDITEKFIASGLKQGNEDPLLALYYLTHEKKVKYCGAVLDWRFLNEYLHHRPECFEADSVIDDFAVLLGDFAKSDRVNSPFFSRIKKELVSLKDRRVLIEKNRTRAKNGMTFLTRCPC